MPLSERYDHNRPDYDFEYERHQYDYLHENLTIFDERPLEHLNLTGSNLPEEMLEVLGKEMEDQEDWLQDGFMDLIYAERPPWSFPQPDDFVWKPNHYMPKDYNYDEWVSCLCLCLCCVWVGRLRAAGAVWVARIACSAWCQCAVCGVEMPEKCRLPFPSPHFLLPPFPPRCCLV